SVLDTQLALSLQFFRIQHISQVTKVRILMSAEIATFSMEKSNAYRAILWGGLTAGIMDITAAFVNSGIQGRSPIWVLQSVASGLLGRDSYTSGLSASALGLTIHFLIAFTATTVFYAASRRLTGLIHHPVI